MPEHEQQVGHPNLSDGAAQLQYHRGLTLQGHRPGVIESPYALICAARRACERRSSHVILSFVPPYSNEKFYHKWLDGHESFT